MFTPEVQRRLDDIGARWNKVEGRLKQAEKVRLEIVVGAINELRYAGRLAVDAFAIAGSDTPHEDKLTRLDEIISEIKNNCVRAHADITDALILFFHKRIDQFIDEFTLTATMKLFPSYSEMLSEIRSVNEFMAKSREERTARADIYEDINANYLPKIEKFYWALLTAEVRLLDEAKTESTTQKVRDFFSEYGLYVGIAGIVLGLMAGFHVWPFP